MNPLKIFISATLALASLAANATTYDFSYTFGDQQQVTGSLIGNMVGSFIENITNVQVALNGVQFSTDTTGSLYALAWNPTTLNWASTPAVVSTNAALNNFIFQDVNDPSGNGVSNYFAITNDATNGAVAFAVNTNNGAVAIDGTSYGQPAVNASNWSVVAVPEPGEWALMLLGFGLTGVLARCRQA
jgi:hypothetical protein